MKDRRQRGKDNRAKLSVMHTSGSKSFARLGHEYKELEDAAIKHPEWTEKTLEQGDLMSHVCGKERNGYVRCIGLGPTPGDLEMPGTQKYRSTKLQMALEGRRQAELENQHLSTRLDELSQQMAELKELFLASSQASRNAHVNPRYASNSPPPEGQQAGSDNSDDESMSSGDILSRETANRVAPKQGHAGGKEVILYSSVRPYDVPVAKGTVLSTDRKTIVGGAPLGSEYCEVVVNYVLKRDAQLFRPNGDMKVMADALGRSIAWAHKHMKEDRKTSKPSQHQAGRDPRRSRTQDL